MSERIHRLELRKVQKQFELQGRAVEVLHDVSFSVEADEALTIMGPSGSGKSTLLHLIGTLDRPSAGEILFDGQSPWDLDDRRLAHFRNRTIGFVFQDAHLLPQYSVLENVVLPSLAFPDASIEPVEGRGRNLLHRVGLGHRLEHRPAELSGGERQRAAVARALVNSPSLLLCDEPTGSLDRSTADAVGELLVEIHREESIQLIVVTHSTELASRFERRLELKEGRCFEA
ncbi:MAG: ABC transporter ATP-binding protein [Deltaproteobacteria bacterium]|nr:ABC transporter ATP-binding protein [Deltaproteobacteria bacterium]